MRQNTTARTPYQAVWARRVSNHRHHPEQRRLRRTRMLAYRGEGYSLADIGRKFGISRQRVWTILHNYRTKDELANR